jgi:hypothetical protein
MSHPEHSIAPLPNKRHSDSDTVASDQAYMSEQNKCGLISNRDLLVFPEVSEAMNNNVRSSVNHRELIA